MKTWLALFISLSIVFNLDAQSLKHQVSSDSILLGNYFIYEIELSNIGKDITYPNLEAFEILSGPNVSSSVSIINGDMSSSKTLSWHLRPTELGQYFIEPISAEHEEMIFEAEPLELNVFPNPNGIIVEPHQNSMDDFFNLNMPPLMNRVDPNTKQTENKKPKRELKKG